MPHGSYAHATPEVNLVESLKVRARALKDEIRVLARASRDRRVGWLPRVLVGIAIAYALSPIDLIPDFIPVLGLLDDLVLVPALLALAIRYIPPDVRAEIRAQVKADDELPRKGAYAAAATVIVVWVVVLAASAWLLLRK